MIEVGDRVLTRHRQNQNIEIASHIWWIPWPRKSEKQNPKRIGLGRRDERTDLSQSNKVVGPIF